MRRSLLPAAGPSVPVFVSGLYARPIRKEVEAGMKEMRVTAVVKAERALLRCIVKVFSAQPVVRWDRMGVRSNTLLLD